MCVAFLVAASGLSLAQLRQAAWPVATSWAQLWGGGGGVGGTGRWLLDMILITYHPSYFTVIFRLCTAVHLVLSAVLTIESSVSQLHLAFAQPLASRARLQGMPPRTLAQVPNLGTGAVELRT
jgi:hypothetical protein